ncbi:MFS transporter [Actinocatenispora rupis]|uniref:MFS transporter n=1 Tax=Actinocatenispora rupis TaxID=519421 RepID=A0A8J3J7X4_9ACTN|nr:MFS transporter [Actinocatenispora rupis]GID11038.1 MFS transporter [Actinocatenispora rupis]
MVHAPRVLGRYPDFRRLFAGNTVSLLGSSVTRVALPLTAVGLLDASPVQMGLLGAAALVPHLVLGLPAGVWIGRLPYRRVLVLADAAQAVLLAAVPVLALTGLLAMWQLYVVVLLAGAGNLFETVTAQSFTPHLVPRERLLPANSALMLSNATVDTSGSALAGLLVTALGAPVAIVADAVSFVVALACKARIRTPGPVLAPVAPRASLRADVVAGIRAMVGDPVLRAVTLAATLGAFGGQLQAVVLLLYLVRTLRFGTTAVGLLVAVAGLAGILGALLATPVTRRLGPGRAFVAGMVLAGVGGPVLAATAGPPALLVAVPVLAQLLRGTGPALYGVNQQTVRQTLTPPGLLSRVNATWRFLVYGTQPLGALLGGVLGAAVGLRATLVVSGAVMLLGAGLAAASPLRRRTATEAPRSDAA